MRELKAQGASIIIISHRLEDIYSVSDRLIVMRQGRKVRDTPVTGNLDDFREGVVAYMIGARDDFAEVTVVLIPSEGSLMIHVSFGMR